MTESKRHHIQPQRYLKGFSIPGRDGWVYLHKLGERGATEQQTHNIALENRYNALRRPDGTIDSTLEGMLADLEAATYPAVEHIAAGGALEGEDRRTLALFVAMMLNRSQRLRRRMEGIALVQTNETFNMMTADPEWRARVFDYLAATQGTTPETFERDAKRLIAGVDIDTPELRNIGLVAHGRTRKLASVLESMRWSYIFAKDESHFLTSDDPVRYVAPCKLQSYLALNLQRYLALHTRSEPPRSAAAVCHKRGFLGHIWRPSARRVRSQVPVASSSA